MIELRITGDNPAVFLAQLNSLAGITSIGQLVQQQRAAQVPQPDPNLTVGEQQAAETVATQSPPTDKPRGRGRPPKSESVSAPETVSPPAEKAAETEKPANGADPGEIPDALKRTAPADAAPKSEIVVPKSVEELRALIQKVCQAKSPAITEAIIKKYGEKTSLIPVEKYPEVAAKLHEAMAA